MAPHSSIRHAYVSSAVVAFAVLTGAGGCSGSVTPDGTGTGDSGADASGGCDCAGIPASTFIKICPDSSQVAATVCGITLNGHCGWTFPPCPGQTCPALGCFPSCANGILKDSNGCDTCQCAPATDAGGTGPCTTSADCGHGGICGFLQADGCSATGQCFPVPTGPRCAIAGAVGCGCNGTNVSIDPSCVSGLPPGYQTNRVLHTGMCTGAADGGDGGGACVSQKGGHCGGNTAQPCTCAPGLTCTPGDSGLPSGDVGGTCE